MGAKKISMEVFSQKVMMQANKKTPKKISIAAPRPPALMTQANQKNSKKMRAIQRVRDAPNSPLETSPPMKDVHAVKPPTPTVANCPWYFYFSFGGFLFAANKGAAPLIGGVLFRAGGYPGATERLFFALSQHF